MSTALTPIDFNRLPSTQLGTDEQFDEFSRNAGFLGRLMLYSKNDAVAQGLIPPGTYGIPDGDKIIKLGPQIDIIPLARRTKALNMNEPVIANYDANSQQFKDIQALSMESNSKCMWGTSFLVFERSSARFLEFFPGSNTARPRAGDIFPFLTLTQADIDRKKAAGADVSQMKPHGPLPCTLKAEFVKSKKGFSWHLPEVHPCSVPFTNLPSQETINTEIEKFTHPTNDVEEVKEEPGKKARAR